jgi:flavin-binding protein dodecin
MQGPAYKVVELVGASPDSIEDAIQAAIGRAGRTLRGLKWFEVVQIRGFVESGAASRYQVVLKVGFSLEEPSR